jgi:DNA polymerase I-like protein with 3'-5' exonuclease and polymerase domains
MLSLTDPYAAQRDDLARHGQQIVSLEHPTETLPLRFTLDLKLSTDTRQLVRYWYVTRPEELQAVHEWLRGLNMVALDLETSGLSAFNDKIATLQLGTLQPKNADDPNAVVIDVRAFSSEQLRPIFDVLESRDVIKLGQNVRFEYRFLRAQYGVRCRRLADTQVAEMIIRAGLLSPKGQSRGKNEERSAYKLCSMAALMDRYSGIEIDKSEDIRLGFYKTPVGQHSLRSIVYAASDVIYPFVIAKEQRKLIEERGLRGIIKVEMELIPVLGEMEHRGMRVDKAQWRALWQEALAKRAEAEAELDEMVRQFTMQPDLFDTPEKKERPIYPKVNRPLNYSSADQVKWVIKQICEGRNWPFEIVIDKARLLDLRRQYGESWMSQQEERGRAVTVEDVPDWLIPEAKYCLLTEADKNTLTLRKCRGQLPADVVDLLMTYSKYDIRCDTFGNDWLLKNVRSDTGRVHTEVHQATTNTGRMSMSPNLQQIPGDERYRRCFLPADEFSYVICDYSQQEPRLLAQVSKDPVYLGTYERGDDLYLAVAEAMLGHRPDKQTVEGKLERKIFKAVVLAMAYRSGARKLRDQLTLGLADAIMAGQVPAPSFEYAAELHKRFFEVHEKVLEFQNSCSSGADPKNRSANRIWDQVAGDMVTYMRAPCGRIRFFPPDAKNTYTEAANSPIQGGSATMTKAAAALIQELIDKQGWQDKAFVVNLVHDEIVCEVHQSIAKEFAPLMKDLMEKAGSFYCPDVKIVAEYPEGSNGVVPFWAKEFEVVA